MAINPITEKDLEKKGVRDQADVPGFSGEEMRRKVEEIARDVLLPKINEIIGYIAAELVTNEMLEDAALRAGSVSSVFGRAGDVKPMPGDYKPEWVGAAKETHAEQHKADGADPILAEDIGAAEKVHVHGDITSDGKIGSTNGMVLMTGLSGKIEAKTKEEAGFMLPPAVKSISGAFTAEDNTEYTGSGIEDFIFGCDEAKTASCHGLFTFGDVGTINLSGFDYIDDPEDIASAESGSRWEFDLMKGCLIIRKRSE